jgi:hypothetical protein
MPVFVTSHPFRRAAAVAALAVLLGSTGALAQNAIEDCMQQGYRPGTAGFYQCLQSATANQRGNEPESPDTGEAGSILGGSPDNAVTDFSSGSSMEGATTPDPEILKQLNTGSQPSH